MSKFCSSFRSGEVLVDDLKIDGSTVSNTATNGNITLTPDGTGNVLVKTIDANSVDNSAATKLYVDNYIQGIAAHQACRVKTTTDINAVEASGWAAGVFTETGTTGDLTIDGVALATGDRVLVADELGANLERNGIYEFNDNGGAGNSWTLTRASDADSTAELKDSSFVFISEGTTNDGTGWLQTATITTLNTDDVTWTQFSSSTHTTGSSIASTGEDVFSSLNGTVLEFKGVEATNTTGTALSASSDANDVTINFNQANITGLGTVTTGTINASSAFAITTNNGAIDTGTASVTAGSLVSNSLDLGSAASITIGGTASDIIVDSPLDVRERPYLSQDTASYTVLISDYLVQSTSASASTYTLPAFAGIANGKQYVLYNSGAGAMTVTADGSEAIDGTASASFTLNQHDRMVVIKAGTTWLTI